MTRNLQSIVSTASLFLLLASGSLAADFPTFVIGRFEGWLESTDQGQHIRLIPFLAYPREGVFWDPEGYDSRSSLSDGEQGIEILPDGRIKFGFKIVDDLRYVRPDLAHLVTRELHLPPSGRPPTISFIRPRYSSVVLEVSGQVVGRHEFPASHLTGTKIGYFYLESTNEVRHALQRGDFRLILTMEYPLATYSSLSLTVDTAAVSSAWVSIARQIRNRAQRTGFSFGPFDFTREFRSAYVKEQIASGSSQRLSTRTSIVTRDATPDQLSRINEVLGLAEVTRQKALELHQVAHQAALDRGQLALADAHATYAEKMRIPGAGRGELSQDVVEKLAGLQDAELHSFFAAGFRAEEATGTGYYRYTGSASVSTTTMTHAAFSEYLIRNSYVEAANIAVPTGDLVLEQGTSSRNLEVFGKPFVSDPQVWASGIARALTEGRLADVRYALSPVFLGQSFPTVDLNLPLEPHHDRLIHLAVRSGDPEAVLLMAQTGADPTRRNRHGETAFDLARQLGRDDLLAVLEPFRGRAGKVVIELAHPEARVLNFQVQNPVDVGEFTVERISDELTRLVIEDFPMTLQARISFDYEVSVSPALLMTARFPYTVVRPTFNLNEPQRIRGQADVANVYRIPDGRTQTYRETLRYFDAETGYHTREVDRDGYFEF